jgi:chromosome segregation ATPase
MEKQETDSFWGDISVPLNEDWQTNGFDLINSVQVAELFAKCTSIAARLAHKAEKLTDQIQSLDFQRSQAQRDLKKLKRGILAQHFKGLPKSANAEIQEAYLLSVMSEEQRQEFDALEVEVDTLNLEIGARTPKLDRYRARLKQLERNLDWMKQYLDFDKLQTRIHSGGRT